MFLIVVSALPCHFEAGGGGNIATAEDALWRAFSNLTTVGTATGSR